MSELFNRDLFFVKERVGWFKAANAYDLFDENGGKIGEVVEDVPGLFKKLLKFTNWRTMLSFTVHFSDATGANVMTLRRPFTFFMSHITVHDHDERVLGTYKQKFKLIKPEFRLFDPSGAEFASLKGDWMGWNFSLVDTAGNELAKITKKWAGLGKELFTTADNYVISLTQPDIPVDLKKVILGAGIGIDMAMKEKKN